MAIEIQEQRGRCDLPVILPFPVQRRFWICFRRPFFGKSEQDRAPSHINRGCPRTADYFREDTLRAGS